MTIDYSVIIRTTGQAGEKYTKLLESIKKLKPQPREIIVVLPEKANLPENQLGYEKFFYSPKGMVIQRMCGIAKCKTRYGLICDDDVVFEKKFVQKSKASSISLWKNDKLRVVNIKDIYLLYFV